MNETLNLNLISFDDCFCLPSKNVCGVLVPESCVTSVKSKTSPTEKFTNFQGIEKVSRSSSSLARAFNSPLKLYACLFWYAMHSTWFSLAAFPTRMRQKYTWFPFYLEEEAKRRQIYIRFIDRKVFELSIFWFYASFSIQLRAMCIHYDNKLSNNCELNWTELFHSNSYQYWVIWYTQNKWMKQTPQPKCQPKFELIHLIVSLAPTNFHKHIYYIQNKVYK